MNNDEKVITALRRCGHYLHHSVGKGKEVESIQLPESFTEAEKEELAVLLEKCLEGWQLLKK